MRLGATNSLRKGCGGREGNTCNYKINWMIREKEGVSGSAGRGCRQCRKGLQAVQEGVAGRVQEGDAGRAGPFRLWVGRRACLRARWLLPVYAGLQVPGA